MSDLDAKTMRRLAQSMGTRDPVRALKIVEMRVIDRMTLQEIADVYGLTRERVRQIEAKTHAWLRSNRCWHAGTSWVIVLALFGEPCEAETAERRIFGVAPPVTVTA